VPIRDFVLVSRFDNRTGDTTFDGSIEYSIARELGRSDAIEVVPTERVIDALQLMKRPINAVLDRSLAREVCLRDGRVKAFVSGLIEKTITGYVLTADLIDPMDGTVVAAVTDTANAPAAVLPTITRDVHRLAKRFSEQRTRIKGAVRLERVSTRSLTALQLFNEALRLAEFDDERAQEAALINDRALAADPSFAVGWIFKAFLLRRIQPPGQQARDAASRAVELAENSPDWERRYIRGLAELLNGEYAASARDLEAAVRLRPDFEPAWDQLAETYMILNKPDEAMAAFKSIADQRPFDIAANSRTAFNIVYQRENPDEARPYVNRLDELLTPDRSGDGHFYWAKRWRALLPAYEAWKAGDVAAARSIIDRMAADLSEWPESSPVKHANERLVTRQMVAMFYISLGRLHDAERVIPNYDLSFLAEAREDLPAQQRLLLEGSPLEDAYRFVNAGLISQARARLRMDLGSADNAINDIGRGAVELATGSPEKAATILRTALARAPFFGKSYQDTCMLLTNALFRVGRRTEAISELEKCAMVLPRFGGNFYANAWMKNLLRLADEYRIVGRVVDAERIEQRLRKLLVYADADNPLVVRLNGR
jgi:tetratricopeptide (TPR) repeat protein